jgi:hypothetical protein
MGLASRACDLGILLIINVPATHTYAYAYIPASSTLAHACSRHRRVSGPRAETRAVRGALDRIALHCMIALHRAAGVYRIMLPRRASHRVTSAVQRASTQLDSCAVEGWRWHCCSEAGKQGD